ncbi:class I SAM-dependent methyltransferase [Actinospica durhamensis]|uniref:Class I SAM-dependent methyltransferase n=1 Tax=Actinospica durhamensis TaxID=1508375 RepID=A0A941IUY7_9ACTN|nr:class I SAM-dependent methyltransferase [Actinospica durhamensis]MBR7838258.1 class I SAM-dependent methyltransferase [Actinospica durhamensis]
MDSVGWDERYRQAPKLWGAAPNRFVAEQLGDRTPGRALDLACGNGRNALWLARTGWRVTAVDFSAVALAAGAEQARAEGLAIEWLQRDVTEYEPDLGAYDAVVIAYLHLSAELRDRALRAAAAALAPGGRLVLVGHDLTNIADGVGGPQDPAVLYTPEAVADALEPLRDVLRVLRAERVTRPVDGEQERQAIDTLVVAEAGVVGAGEVGVDGLGGGGDAD